MHGEVYSDALYILEPLKVISLDFSLLDEFEQLYLRGQNTIFKSLLEFVREADVYYLLGEMPRRLLDIVVRDYFHHFGSVRICLFNQPLVNERKLCRSDAWRWDSNNSLLVGIRNY